MVALVVLVVLVEQAVAQQVARVRLVAQAPAAKAQQLAQVQLVVVLRVMVVWVEP